MTGDVQILNVTQITVSPLPQPQPPPMKLSLFDAQFICFNPIKRILLYANPNTNLPFPSLIQIFKCSLSAALLDYLPLAGKLTFAVSTGDIEIDFSDPNVTFVEAESDLELHQLATDEIHDVGCFLKLTPMVDVSVLPFSVFAVQMTRFACGGVAIGYSAHHAVVDGKAMWQFIKAWTSLCRAKMSGEVLMEGHKPSYDRAMIKHPRGEEITREILRSAAPFLPRTGAPSLASMEDRHLHLTQRNFVLDAPSIQALKQRCAQQEEGISASQTPSTFLILSAHAWISFVRARSLKPDERAVLAFVMDCRSRLDPPIQDSYFGNCIRFVYVTSLASELVGENGLTRACLVISKAIRDTSRDPLSDCENWVADAGLLTLERVCNVAASPKFQVYESDFGWGKPDRVELASHSFDGEIALVAGKDDGTVQFSVALNSSQIDSFVKLFLGGMSRY